MVDPYFFMLKTHLWRDNKYNFEWTTGGRVLFYTAINIAISPELWDHTGSQGSGLLWGIVRLLWDLEDGSSDPEDRERVGSLNCSWWLGLTVGQQIFSYLRPFCQQPFRSNWSTIMWPLQAKAKQSIRIQCLGYRLVLPGETKRTVDVV